MPGPNETIVNPIDEDERFVGISLPLTNSRFGYFSPTQTTRDAALTNLKNLILTMKKERPLQPEFGCDIHSLIFEPIGNDMVMLIDSALRDAIEEWLPYITVENVIVNLNNVDIDNNNIRVTLKYSIGMMADSLDELTFTTAGGILVEDVGT